MSDKKELIFLPKALPIIQNFSLVSKKAIKTLRSFDIMEWDETPYGSQKEQTMTMFELNDLAPRDGWPTVLMIHGGGWVSGSPLSMSHIAPLFARHGVMACTMRYRLAPKHPWPAQSQDVHAALDFLRSQQVDLSRIALWGFSAGAHLALHAAKTYPHPLAAVVAIAPPVDLHALPFDSISSCFREDQLEEATLIGKKGTLPPTLLVHGTADQIFPSVHSRRFAQLEEQVTYREIEKGNHGLHWPLLAGRRAKRKAISWLIETLDLPSRGSKWKRRKKKNR